MLTILPIETIVSDPDIRGGKPIIAGTTLRVSDIGAWHTFGGQSAEEIAVNFHMNMAQVYAALSYYYAHKHDIDAEIRSNSEGAEKWLQELRKQGKLITVE
jgi:uncharacterized protein (DUF433 family)